MSTYSTHLARARLEALTALIEALRAAETPAEKRRCATAIFNAPEPSEIDNELGAPVPPPCASVPPASMPSSPSPSSNPGAPDNRLAELDELLSRHFAAQGIPDPCEGLSDDEILASAAELARHLIAPRPPPDLPP